MLVFRSFAIGLGAACFALLVMRPSIAVRVEPMECSVPSAATSSVAPTIVDAAPGITAAQLAATMRLAPGEYITSVDETSVPGDLGAGIVLASRELRSGQFIDVGVSGPEGDRRVLVLLH